MARTPTRDIMTEDIIFKNRREQPPDVWREAASD
jgi:hypothetical protein